jgi:SAM-dependent methyltransferase
MKWVLKAAAKKALSWAPAGRTIDFLIQSKITKTLPVSDETFLSSVRFAAMHIDQFRKHGSTPIERAKFFEFGIGWDLVGPLAFHVMGVTDQTLCDISYNLRLSLINHSLATFYRFADRITKITGAEAIRLPRCISSESEIATCGMRYVVGDMTKLFRATAQFDYITSISVLEHVPAADLPQIVNKCYSLLKPAGVVSFVIDMRDHYVDFDRSISDHNFLRYSDRAWNLFFNSTLHHQNRLQFTDYLQVLKEANFELVNYSLWEAPLNGTKIHPSFREKYNETSLGVTTLCVTARRN